MKMRKKRGIYIVIILVFSILIVSSIVSAGIIDWLKKTITGKASTTQQTNVSIAVAGLNPVYITVWNDTLAGTVVDPTEEGATTLIFNVTVSDDDGASDINDSSVQAEFTNDTTTRGNLTCTENTGESTSTSQNYTCTIEMLYFDGPVEWMINVTANDLGNVTYYSNYSQHFGYNQLQAIVITPQALTWPSVSPGDTNQTSNNDPTIINNTGNYNATGNLQVQAYNLHGTNTEFIPVENFSVGLDTGDTCTGDLCIECNATTTFLVNGTATTITGGVLERGNLTLGESHSNETFYYCEHIIPSTISSQTYSTQNAGSAPWVIQII